MKRGRPKMSRAQHLGDEGPLKREARLKRESIREKNLSQVTKLEPDTPTYKEMAALLTEVYEKVGPSSAIKILEGLGVDRLKDLDEEHYPRLSRVCFDRLGRGKP